MPNAHANVWMNRWSRAGEWKSIIISAWFPNSTLFLYLSVVSVYSWVVFHLIRMQKCALYTSVEHVTWWAVCGCEITDSQRNRDSGEPSSNISAAHMCGCRLPMRWRGNEHKCICMMCSASHSTSSPTAIELSGSGGSNVPLWKGERTNLGMNGI